MSEGLSRRSFLKLAATAGAAAAIPGCQPAARKLIPYVVPDENVIPGVPAFYATTCSECPAGCGLVARIREGRVIKLEGNPVDPVSQGSICARGQAALEGLYNPDRLAHPQRRRGDGRLETIGWDEAIRTFNDHLTAAAKAGKDRVAFIGTSQGPTLDKIAGLWATTFQSSRVVFYEALDAEPAHAAAQACFGRRDLPAYRIDKAEALISFGADFLETWNSPVELARQYATFRAPAWRRGTLTIGRSAYVGPFMNLTAAKCDEWIAVAPGAEATLAFGLLNVLLRQGWVSDKSGVDLDALKSFVAAYDPAAVSARTGVPREALTRIGEWFGQAEGSVALAGTDDQQTHVAAFILNAVTNNIGNTVLFFDDSPPQPTSRPEDVNTLVEAMRQKQVDVLVVAGGNPLYSMPPAARLRDAVKQVPFVVWMGGVPDETAELANLLMPIHHPLESWRDTAPRAGLHGLGQPVMQPVFDSQALGDLLLSSAHLGGGASAKRVPWENAADAVSASWQELQTKVAPKEAAAGFWDKVRREGGFFEEAKASTVSLNPAVLKPGPPPAVPAAGELTLVAFPHIFFYDGRGADKPWLQEIPEPVTQIVWDTWVAIHPDTARKLGLPVERRPVATLKAGSHIAEFTSAHGTIEAPVYVTEYVKPDVIAVPIGQGHTALGRWAKDRGANPWSVLPPGLLRVAVKARPTGNERNLIRPLGSSDMMRRSLVESISLEELAKGIVPSEEELQAPEPYEMYAPFKYPTHMWGMTIDVNACTGCSACVAACYAENNVAVVGREGVDRGRIMSWIRTERYFPPRDKADKAPLMYIMPMLCQQCAQAPCEPVCPVFAAYHTEEGLNGQNYNRCIGTRYCENNCPYKVRRFNWFDYDWPEPLNLQLNPDVTTRTAGVMEKCTFCMQRIVAAEINAKVEERPLTDGEIVPACAQACPTRAISFGDMNEPNSAMMKRRRENKLRNYRALDDLNTRPAIVYLRDIYREKGRA
jgi:anaerobic selenocysteine-containing dehydrogenase/Fe-S-cluster-containing dehydrogenase component